MSESVAPGRICRFPGCERPAAPAEEGRGPAAGVLRGPHAQSGRGLAGPAAPPRRWPPGGAVPDDLDRPVSMARARAGEYAERVGRPGRDVDGDAGHGRCGVAHPGRLGRRGGADRCGDRGCGTAGRGGDGAIGAGRAGPQGGGAAAGRRGRRRRGRDSGGRRADRATGGGHRRARRGAGPGPAYARRGGCSGSPTTPPEPPPTSPSSAPGPTPGTSRRATPGPRTPR